MTENETVRIDLRRPVEHNGKSYDHLVLREPEMGDMIAMDSFTGESAKTAALIASVSGVPLPAVKRIRASDLPKVQEALEKLMGNSLELAPGEAPAENQ